MIKTIYATLIAVLVLFASAALAETYVWSQSAPVNGRTQIVAKIDRQGRFYAQGLVYSPVTVTSNATLSSNVGQVFIGTLNGARTYTLAAPQAGAAQDWQDSAGNVNVAGDVTLKCPDSMYLNGVQNGTYVIATTRGGATLRGVDATHWIAR